VNQVLRDPITAENWAKWSPRLQEWSNEDFEKARPAFQRAFELVRVWQTKSFAEKKKAPWKALEDDPVAWMVLAGSYLHTPNRGEGPVAAAKSAEKPAQECIRRNNKLARGHFYLAWAYWQQQLTLPKDGGPAKPDVRRLQDALKQLLEARELAPGVEWMKSVDAGKLAVKAQKWEEAETFLTQALATTPEDTEVPRLLARAIVEQGQGRAQRGDAATSVAALAKQFPNDAVIATYNVQALRLLQKEDAAIDELARARKLGGQPETVIDPGYVRHLDEVVKNRKKDADQHAKEEERRKQEEERRKQEEERRNAPSAASKFFDSVVWWTIAFTIFYGSIMGLMCLAGWLLARRTRGAHAADILASDSGEMTSGGKVVRSKKETTLARLYLAALMTALVLFYLSLPFVFIGLLLVFLLLLVCMFFVRRGSQGSDVHAALMKASTGGIGAIFKATFARTGTGRWGVEKDAQECPRLWKAIEEVARRVDTEPPDEVWVAPDADFYVFQEGRGPFGVFGSRKRVLTVGLCVLNFISISEFKSILAHEFAHFSHADTHWSRFLFQVTLSLRTAMREMARTGGWVTWVNPFFWFFYLYSKSYSMLSSGFSRSREFLADRMACTLYGSDVFMNGLQKVILEGSPFWQVISKKIGELLKKKKRYVNMYLAFRKEREKEGTDDQRRKLQKQLLNEEPSMFASHPTFVERRDAAKVLPPAMKSEAAPSLQLFEKPDKVEEELTDYVMDLVEKYLDS
jgi:Zn-dependent protease with chaperone function